MAPSRDDVSLVELGLDSFGCAQWLHEVNRTLGLSLTVAQVCGHPTFRTLSALFEGAMGEQMSATPPGSSAARGTSAPGRRDIAAHLRESLAAELELVAADIDDEAPFVELGLDSITGVTWTRKLNTHFQLSLSATQVYSHPTVDELAGHLAELLGTGEPGRASAEEPVPVAAPVAARGQEPAESALAAWLRASLAKELELTAAELDDDAPFVELGLDSISGVTWTRSLNTRLRLSLSATTVYGHPTISDLARYLTREHGAVAPDAVAEARPEPAAEPEPEPAAVVEPEPIAVVEPEPTAEPEREPEPQPAAEPQPAPEAPLESKAVGGPARAPGLVDIAVIGMSGAFPQAENVDAFWRNILEGRDCISEVPSSRWSVERFYDERPGVPGKSSSKWMGVLDHADRFDPLFFSISPGEAAAMDPQQRVLLQESWACVEEAGYSPDDLSGTRCGVFVGCSVNGYGATADAAGLSAHQNLGTNSAILASRISYTLNLKGPCLSIDTSCSSSLVAIAQACDSLCLGDSDTALAGGVWVIPGPGVHVAMSQLRALSPDGRCYAFDERANGFVPAEGVGVLLLKRLADAQADGDRIHAVIKGWGVNQDGRSNGITAPSAEAQARLQKHVYDKFGIDPGDIELVEAHGTGTALGDPVEIDGLVDSFTARTDRRGHCAVGSVKSNIGHTACAAGVAGVLKATLALEHATLPPTAQYERLNEHIDLDGTPFYVNTRAREWRRADRPRLAAVSSFGYSGTNAHVVLAEAPAAAAETSAERPGGSRLIALSARTAGQLKDRARQLAAHLEARPGLSLRDVSHTLGRGRKHFRHRLAFVVDTTAGAASCLRTWLETGSAPSAYAGDHKPQRPARPDLGAARELTDPDRLRTLAEEYAQGAAVAFELLFTPDRRPARVSLPTYPFAQDSYWLPGEAPSADAPSAPEQDASPAPEPDSADEPEGPVDLLALEPCWTPLPTPPAAPDAEPDDWVVWLVGPGADAAGRALRTRLPRTVVLHTSEVAADRPLDAAYARLTRDVLGELRTRIAAGDLPDGGLAQIVVLGHGAPDARVLTGVTGLLRTAALEHPWLRAQLLEHLDPFDAADDRSAAALAEAVEAGARAHAELHIRQEGGRRYARRLTEAEARPAHGAAASPWRDGGVHLITGGTGGLGLHVARDLARTLRTGTVVLVGRSAPETARPRLAALATPGVTVEYRQADVTDRAAVDALVADVVARHGALHGVVHCAGVLRDGYLATKKDGDLAAVLAPKTTGLVNLDEATADQPLDHLVVFSSTAAALGSAGQGDYAAANAFLDTYVEYRAGLAARGLRSGRAVSIGWPLWADGGMRLDGAALERLRGIGVTPLPTEDGLRALTAAVAGGARHTLLLCGDRELLRGRLAAQLTTERQPTPQPAPAAAPRADRRAWERTLAAAVSEQLKVPAEEIDGDGEFGEYGFDSISLTELVQRLNDAHGLSLAPTVFFEHTTVGALAAHIAEHAPTAPAAPAPAPAPALDAIRQAVIAEVSGQLKVPAEEIEGDGEFGEYGFDSISLTELASRLGDRFGVHLAPTVFFEHRTVDSVAAHLAETAPAPKGPAAEVPPQDAPLEDRLSPEGPSGEPGTDPTLAAEPIAVIGMSGSFPQAPDLSAFWDNLYAGKDCITEIPGDRWDWRALEEDPDVPRGKKPVRWGGFLDGVDRFDPLFFGISPREARTMDPQQRLLLTHAWQALEDSGYAPSGLAGSDTAVLIGTAPSGYGSLVMGERAGEDGYAATGVSGSVGPNRVSYLLDLHGPSEPVETACSSSLVALHRGVELLRSGRSGLALVGGVNTIVSPDLHIGYSRAGMLCEDGRCKTFSARANGYVRGEGVGVLVLKPLHRARRDGDRILGVIRGSAVNHGGRAHSLTAPNPRAQADLLKSAYRDAGVDPRTVTYVEAHGTGTELGDPVELNGLKSAFGELYAETAGAPGHLDAPARCGLGSVKSNIGHLELAAGVAGVIKVLLQMRHATLVESLHCADLNPYLDFADSPFEVVRERQPWQRPRDAEGRALPRRAGVSSFGFGGVNAHVVIEEYVEERDDERDKRDKRDKPDKHDEYAEDHGGHAAMGSHADAHTGTAGAPAPAGALIPLSARTEEQLVARARALRDHLRAGHVAAGRLTDLAFTLQVGRDAMEERLATRVTSLADLEHRLTSFVADPAAHEGWHRGTVSRRTGAAQDPARRPLTTGGRDEALAQWVAGHALDWRSLYEPGARPARIGLPTYPFAEERYWAGRGTAHATEPSAARPDSTPDAHPMLHRAPGGTPTAYRTVFDGAEPFLKDHQVRGLRVLPGAAHLEMARAAVARTAAAPGRVRLSDVVWLRPATCATDDGLDVRLDLKPTGTDGYAYTLHTVGPDGERALSSQGRAHLADAPAERPALPLADLRAACAATAFTAADVYGLYDRVGMEYGPAQRSLTALAVGTDTAGRPQALAELRLPRAAEPADAYGLHPSILDGALQATIGLGLGGGEGAAPARPALPFALQGVDVLAATPATAYAWIRYQDGSRPGDTSAKLDITLVDTEGRVCAELTGLLARVLPAEAAPQAAAPTEPPVEEASGTPLAERALPYLRDQLATALEVAPERLDVDTPLEFYGMDSMMAMELTQHLEDTFGGLSKTLFFEVRTVRALSEHFADEYPQRLRAALGTAAPEPASQAPAPAPAQAETAVPLPDAGRVTDIAIVGVSGRYPLAENLDEFWHNLRSGRDCVTEVPADRWDPRDHEGTSRWGGFVDGVDRFDPLFFRVSPREAEFLDPQERLFLECVHHTLEDAGYTGETLSRQSTGPADAGLVAAGKVGVFVGVMYEEYQLYGAQAQARGHRVALSGSPSSIANRISYFYDFHGPSMAVDTMCSSSLTAIHLACEAIRSGQCAAAVAGGVNVSVHPNKYVMLSQGKFTSSDGRCRSFGEGGDGYVPGEGVGAVLLKPLERAIADGDQIHAVIKGTALNHGGRTHGFSVPNPAAQGDVITRALARAGVAPHELSYLEAHGTGTSLGDPIELTGLVKAFGRTTGAAAPTCAIGSVKSNIGHCESAAGIAGVTKVLLQMRHGELVPSLHASTLNPHLDFDGTPFAVQRDLAPWHGPRVAGVSSFGAGGANAHVVLAAYEPEGAPAPSRTRPVVVPLSAATEGQLIEAARRLLARADGLAEDDLAALAWTLQTGRVALEERLAFTAESLESLRRTLGAFLADPAAPGDWVRGRVRADQAPAAADGEATGPQECAARWARGEAVDWDRLYAADGTARPRRLSLPGYPFARERHWLDLETATGGASAPSDHVLLTHPVWEAEEAGDATAAPQAERHVVLVGRFAPGEEAALTTALASGAHLETVALADDAPVHTAYLTAARHVFARARALLTDGVRGGALLQVVLVGDRGQGATDRAVFGGLSGLLRTVALENPKLRTQLVDCLDGAAPAVIAERLRAETAPETDPEVRYRAGRREVRRLTELAPAPDAGTTPWRAGGVYLITGGTGALGLLTARDIASAAAGATVVLTGRSALDEAQRRALDELRAAGLTVDHQRTDVTDRADVERLVAHIARTHGPLTGVVHAAGVLRDNLVVNKEPEEFTRVLAPKVAGLVHLDEATRDQPLELFLCYSSTTGALGNAGQADYAAGNAFMDAYAAHRGRLAAAGARHGLTLSLNWPLWADGGMGVDTATEDRLRRMDLVPLDTESGLRALRTGVAARRTGLADGQLLVVAGRRDAVLPRLTARPGRAPQAEPHPAAEPEAAASGPKRGAVGDDRALLDRTRRHLRAHLAAGLKLGADRLDAEVPLERYGMDSVVAMNLIAQLETDFGTLPKTLFFEVQTVRELAEYFVAQHGDALRALFGETATAVPEPTPAPAPPAAEPARAEREQASPAAAAPLARDPRDEGVAIIGLAGRYPGAADPEALWGLLRSGADCVTEVPADRWDHDAVFDPDRDAPGKSYGKWGGFLDGVDQFDPLHFGISPREAETMDPQQRLFLETVWQLLEQSGVTQEAVERTYRRRVGVYVGAMYQMYRADTADVVRSALTSAASYNLIANRVSHFFGLEGPSLAVDGMCASSAAAIHLACADLLSGDSELAIAGGVNLTVHPDKYRALSRAGLLGSHPGSRSFQDGDGYLPAEAVGAVLLKPLAAARRDGDTVLAVIKGSASLHGGRAGQFMAPSRRTQVNVARRALEKAGCDPASIGYVEAAANGSALGDAVEAGALREVFGAVTEPIALGSVKSHLGHPEAASGIAQLTKVVLQLRHRELAPRAAVGTPNPELRLDEGPLRLCESLTPWEPRPGTPRRALLNSVGAGGSHVSLVVEEAPRAPAAERTEAAPPQPRRPELILLSAGDPERLRAAARLLHDFVERTDEPGADDAAWLADVAHTLRVGREALAERLAFVTDSRAGLLRALADFLADRSPHTPLYRGDAEAGAATLGDLLAGGHGEAFVRALVADGELDRLAELWVRGGRIPWRGLHTGQGRRLVPLPTTAFRRKRYWVGHTGTPTAAPTQDTAPHAGQPEPVTESDGGGHGHGDDILRYLADHFTEALGFAPGELPLDKDLHGLGADSVLWVRLRRGVETDLGLTLTTREIVELATLERIAERLAAKRGTRTPQPPEAPDVREARAKALEEFRQGHVGLEELKSLMKEAPGA
ncbi:SDR family NAD(P)-dependent oxidoreductase [Streptomyces spectabilis]|uniref:SDR family NAD(P)-dependent oxidoreductase n=1 Tax=Streptomyces spectabilis TaxID=68270 RepID=UPI0016767CAD|nr:SDR family NAD(P)-dependent oxidoreductase [Streptomyces spectabilis]MCI3900370.1 SDR family NAD(P)-dependent oxidoreductase [Streptomyces spectabilis]